MTDQDRKEFAGIMAVLGVAFRTEVSKPLMAIYFQDLEHRTIQSIAYAADRARKELKFFPSIADLNELSREYKPPRQAFPVNGGAVLIEWNPPELSKARMDKLIQAVETGNFEGLDF